LDLQLRLLERLVESCPNLRAVTFEDPRLDGNGALDAGSRASWEKLRAITQRWSGPRVQASHAQTATQPPSEAELRDPRHEERLAEAIYDVRTETAFGLAPQARAAMADSVRDMVLARAHRGTGGLRQWFPRTLAAWLSRHPDDVDLIQLVTRFCASAVSRAWREALGAPLGLSLEEALYRFFDENAVADAATREEELLGALMRGLAVCPRARFLLPPSVRVVPGGHAAVSRQSILHAAVDGRYLTGPITPAVAAVLRGDATAHDDPKLQPVREHLATMRLWPVGVRVERQSTG
jgi:hypothetical protein